MISHNVTGTMLYQIEFDYLNGTITPASLSRFLGFQIQGWIENTIRVCNQYDPDHYWEFDFLAHKATNGKRNVYWQTNAEEEAFMIFFENIKNNYKYHMARLQQARRDGAYIHAETLDLVYRVPGWTEEYTQFFKNGIAVTN